MGAGSNKIPRAIAYFGIGLPIALVFLEASPFGANLFYVIAGIPAFLLIWLAVGTWSAIICSRFVARGLWFKSLQAAILPLAIIGVSFNLLGFIHFCIYSGDVVHFVVARPYYDNEIASLPHTDQPRLAVFNWGGMIWASRGLVYDESDQVALPPGRQSAAWLANPARAELVCDGYAVQPLWSHYYLAQFPC